jgi:protoporphyrinogen oxidase
MKLAVLGSGMAAFGAAHRFHEEGLRAVMYDQHAYYGGHTASHAYEGGWVFDEGPHISYTKEERIRQLFEESVDGEYEAINARVNNYFQGHWIKHPAQVNLYGLPVDLVTLIIKDFVEARYADEGPIETYADWLVASFGRTFAETFPMRYGLKFHTTAADNMSTDWIGPRLYRPELEEVIRGALGPNPEDVHYITDFRYPSRGGFVSFLRRFLGEAELRLGHRVVAVDPSERCLSFSNGATASYDGVVSSIPLPVLVPMISGVPSDVLAAAQRLACSEAVIVNLGIGRPDLIDAHWTYFYDPDVFFTRVSTPHLQSPNNVPPGCGSLQVECYFSPKYKPLDRAPDECIQPVIDDLRRCGILSEDDEIRFSNAMHVPFANVIFDLERADALATVHGYLDEVDIKYCGRYGDWAYIWTDQSFMSGESAAQRVIDGSAATSRATAG